MRPTPADLSNRIREYREALDISQAQLAGIVGVTVGAISAYELGQKMPSTATAMTIARALGTTVEGLFVPTASTPSVETSSDRPDSATAAANGGRADGTSASSPSGDEGAVAGFVAPQNVDQSATESDEVTA